MSEENVEIVRGAYEAWGKGDSEAVIEAIDPEMEWDWSSYPLPDVTERGKGRENYLGFLAEFSASWGEHEITLTELIDVGEHVAVAIHEKMRASGRDLALERDIAHLCTLPRGGSPRSALTRRRLRPSKPPGLRSRRCRRRTWRSPQGRAGPSMPTAGAISTR